MADLELLELLLSDPQNGLVELMDKYTGLVHVIVYNKLQGTCLREDIEECVSNIFFSFFRNINKIDLDRGSIKAFLTVIAKRRSIEVFRSMINMNCIMSMEETMEEVLVDQSQDIEKKITNRETKEELLKMVHLLGKPDSEIILRKYFYGQSSKEIANSLGLKENTVNKKISRSLAKMRNGITNQKELQEVKVETFCFSTIDMGLFRSGSSNRKGEGK